MSNIMELLELVLLSILNLVVVALGWDFELSRRRNYCLLFVGLLSCCLGGRGLISVSVAGFLYRSVFEFGTMPSPLFKVSLVICSWFVVAAITLLLWVSLIHFLSVVGGFEVANGNHFVTPRKRNT